MASLKYNMGFLRGLLSREKAYVGPYYVHLDITHRCNLKCLCCRWHSPLFDSLRDKTISPDLDVDVFSQLCDDLQALGTRELYFVGTGEPLIHRRIIDLVRIAKDKGFKLVLYTNGLLLDETIIQQLMDLKLDVLRVSLWATSAEKFTEQVAGMTPDKFDRIIDNMALVSRLKAEQGTPYPLLELCQSITHQNLDDLDETVELARRTRCEKLCFSPIVDFHKDELKPFVPDVEGKEKARKVLTRIKGELKRHAISNNIDVMLLHYQWDGRIYDKYPCYPAWYFTYIRTDGSVFACQRNTNITRPLGNLGKDRFIDIWNNAAYRAFRRQVSTCEGLSTVQGYYCDYCSHSLNTQRVDQKFRYFKPLQRLLGKPRQS